MIPLQGKIPQKQVNKTEKTLIVFTPRIFKSPVQLSLRLKRFNYNYTFIFTLFIFVDLTPVIMRLRSSFIFSRQFLAQSIFFLLLSGMILVSVACGSDHSPKPEGYFRIDFPGRDYTLYENGCPFTFEYPSFAKVIPDSSANAEPCWLNIDFPGYRGRLHLSYKEVEGNVNIFIEDARKLAFKHTVKADAIDESMFFNHEERVFATLYDISGDVASSVQFYATDSTGHFLRGALYFHVQPNKDSLAPVIRYFREDIVNLIETLRWE